MDLSNQEWRTREGDDLSWAQPGFDDSQWTRTTLAGDALTIRPGWRWYRLNMALPRQDLPLALLIQGSDNAYEAYADGIRLDGARILSPGMLFLSRPRLLSLPQTGPALTLALRVRYSTAYTEIYSPSIRRILIGSPAAIETERRLASIQAWSGPVSSIWVNLALLLGGFAFLALFAARRKAREYLWLALYLILSGIGSFLIVADSAGVWPIWTNDLGDPLTYPTLILLIEFAYAFAGRKVGRTVRVCEWLMLCFSLISLLVTLTIFPVAFYLPVEITIALLVSLFVPALLVSWTLRGNREAAWLILPSLLTTISICVGDLGLVAGFMRWQGLEFLNQPIALGPIRILFNDLADLLFLIAIGVVMLLRFTRISGEQARATAELDAAREVQQHLVPAALPPTPGYSVEAAYLPAAEVGGDFYQVLSRPDGSSIFVVGDVSGKGLKAAMTGTLLLGALRTLAEENLPPGALLARLNRQAHAAAHGGFITCICARLTPSGAITIANAGHLAPYIDGKEIAVENGLPLGIVSAASYAETRFQLHPGNTLILLSDGVVEAQNPAGELFGFERTAAISTESVQKITQAAQAFGQTDDITALRICFHSSSPAVA